MSFSEKAVKIIQSVPYGKVATYGQIAVLAGSPRSTRQISWILHSCSEKNQLPWHRIINSRGFISLKPGYGFELQKKLLEEENIVFDSSGRINFKEYLWSGK